MKLNASHQERTHNAQYHRAFSFFAKTLVFVYDISCTDFFIKDEYIQGAVAKWYSKGLQNPYTRVRFPPAPQKQVNTATVYDMSGIKDRSDVPQKRNHEGRATKNFNKAPRGKAPRYPSELAPLVQTRGRDRAVLTFVPVARSEAHIAVSVSRSSLGNKKIYL